MLLTGAKIYRDASRRDRESYDQRTVAQYLTTRIRQSDLAGGYYIGEFNSKSEQSEGDTFFSFMEIEGDLYHTRIYCHDGYLYELLTLVGDEFDPKDGEKIAELNDLSFKLEGNAIKLTVEYSDGTKGELYVLMRHESEAS